MKHRVYIKHSIRASLHLTQNPAITSFIVILFKYVFVTGLNM